MAINPHIEEIAAAAAYATINNSIRSLDLDEFNGQTAIADTFKTQLQRLAKLYIALKPLLAAVATLPLLPQSWRVVLGLFVGTLDTVASSPGVDPDFKAGKDL
jgi:hypothetical protein